METMIDGLLSMRTCFSGSSKRYTHSTQLCGVQVYDGRIKACLRVHGVTRLLIFNTKDFVRYSGFIAVDPAQI